MKWTVNSSWGLKVLFEDGAKKERQIACIKLLSTKATKETIYKFTGFKNINGKNIFLHSGGAIGTAENVKVDLEDEVLSRFTFTNKEFDIKDALKKSLLCLEIAPRHVTTPLISFMYLAPLTSIFEKIGIPIGFLMWLLGEQQSKKTSVVTAVGSHFRIF